MRNRTLSTILWDDLALMCHSAGCDSTLHMIFRNNTMYKVFIIYSKVFTSDEL